MLGEVVTGSSRPTVALSPQATPRRESLSPDPCCGPLHPQQPPRGGRGPLSLGALSPQPSVYELVRAPGFAHLPLVVEDFVKDAGACFSGEWGPWPGPPAGAECPKDLGGQPLTTSPRPGRAGAGGSRELAQHVA